MIKPNQVHTTKILIRIMCISLTLLAVIVLSACKDNKSKIWTETSIENITTHDGSKYLAYGGTVTYNKTNNSYSTISHTKMDCVLDNNQLYPLKAPCKKADFVTTTLENNSNYLEGRVTKYSFDLTVNSINLDTPPDWIIIFQDWVDIDQNDSNGNHPISTLKLKVVNGKLSINHYENSWQFGYKWDKSGLEDKNHSLHQKNTLHGSAYINVGVTYKIEITIKDSIDSSGYFIVSMNGEIFSNAKYQTKFEGYSNNAINSWGIYINKGYDIGLYKQFDKTAYEHILYSPENQINIEFSNLKKYIQE